MKKIIQKSLITLFCVLLASVLLASVLGCTNYEDYGLKESTDGSEQSHLLVLDNVVYHTGTESYMIPQNDPYTLTNFQNAFEKLALGNSNQILTRSQTDEFLGSAKLEATHYALKIYPKNEDEQWKIELMEDVKISYIPLDYVQLLEKDEKQIATTRSLDKIPVFSEKSSFNVTYDDLETTEGPIAPESYSMPILYVVWPCEKPLPDNLNYEIDYKVFIPSYNINQTRNSSCLLSMDALQILENEAISIALGAIAGTNTRTNTRSSSIINPSGEVSNFGTLLGSVPLANLKVQLRLGSNIWETFTQSHGRFSMPYVIPREATFYFVLQHPRWKITTENSTTPLAFPVLTGMLWTSSGMHYITASTHYQGPFSKQNSLYEVHRAVNYYYHGVNELTRYYHKNGIRIRVSPNSNGNILGQFTYSKKSDPFITIYNSYEYFDISSPEPIGTTLHELGHFTMYGMINGYNGFNGVHTLLHESWVSYVGWYLGKRYYKANG